MTVWSGTQNPHNLRADLALLLDMPEDAIAIHRMETAGCYGRNCADDVGRRRRTAVPARLAARSACS